jgi:spermidine/putrescine transport system permease protein
LNSQPSSTSKPWLILPSLLWYLFFLATPLAIIAAYSFLTKGVYGDITRPFTFENYQRALDPLYLNILWDSFKLAITTTLLCLAIGFPVAYVMATARRSLRTALLVLLVIPFWTNMVVKTYGIRVVLGDQGPINQILLSLGLISSPISFVNTWFAVVVGMVANYLPFMVLPLSICLDKLDFSLLEAARDLGASGLSVFRRVLLPLAKPGIASGSILVFTPALGEFLIPDLLGGAKTLLVGNLIIDQFLKMRDWPFGAALSFILMILVVTSVLGLNRFKGAERD